MINNLIYEIRRLHGNLHNKNLEHRIVQKKIREYRYPIGRKIYIIGTPLYKNLGDSAILIAQIRFFEKVGFDRNRIKEITSEQLSVDADLLKRAISPRSLLCGMGGGNMGNQWLAEEEIRYEIFRLFPDNPMIIFPQTIHFIEKNKERDIHRAVSNYSEKKNLVMIAREEHSRTIMKKLFPTTQILFSPDIVLACKKEDYGVSAQRRSGVLFCVRNDEEKAIEDVIWSQLDYYCTDIGKQSRMTDMNSLEPVTVENRFELVRNKMLEFCRAELVITDRLHGMIFAALTETPCIVFGNYNHKVVGSYQWLSHLKYVRYVETVEEAKQLISELLKLESCYFDNAPFTLYFQKIAEVVREKCQR